MHMSFLKSDQMCIKWYVTLTLPSLKLDPLLLSLKLQPELVEMFSSLLLL